MIHAPSMEEETEDDHQPLEGSGKWHEWDDQQHLQYEYICSKVKYCILNVKSVFLYYLMEYARSNKNELKKLLHRVEKGSAFR